MITYDNYFQAVRHISEKKPEAFIWEGIDSTGLAEVMELADQNGYNYKLDCYDKLYGDVPVHKRRMIFTPKEKIVKDSVENLIETIESAFQEYEENPEENDFEVYLDIDDYTIILRALKEMANKEDVL